MQMILLYRDPQGETVTTIPQQPSMISTFTKRNDSNEKEGWEVKISALEKAIKDKDNTI